MERSEGGGKVREVAMGPKGSVGYSGWVVKLRGTGDGRL